MDLLLTRHGWSLGNKRGCLAIVGSPYHTSRADSQGAERVLLQHSEDWCWGELGMPARDESWRNTAVAKNGAQERGSREGIPDPPPLPPCSLHKAAS